MVWLTDYVDLSSAYSLHFVCFRHILCPLLFEPHSDSNLETAAVIPNLDDFSSFRQWFLPADNTTTFRVAADCAECIDGQFEDNTAYHLYSGAFCRIALSSSGCVSDRNDSDYHSESCNQCDAADDDSIDDDGHWTKCYALHLSADYEPSRDHSTCTSHALSFRPTISRQRDGCTCFQSKSQRIEYQVALSDLPLITSSADTLVNELGLAFIAENIQFDPDWTETEDDNAITEDARESNVVALYQSDFLHGTYRIVESGTYVIMEDITFDFNKPSDIEMAADSFSPNSIDGDELYWFPTHSQAESGGDYPGLYDYEGVYTLGFFAGITVEADFVTIDLNGHRLEQSEHFYFQQRFFVLIEMASRPFVPGEGPADWGVDDQVYPSHLEIKDGVLGRSSHHGLHGINIDDVVISNVVVEYFDIAGFQCNGCNNVVVRDCVFGPQNRDIPVLGRYTHSRALLPRFKQLVDDHGEEEIVFYGRDAMTVSDLVDRLTNQMDMVYFAHFEGVQYAEDDEEWIGAMNLFLNPTGWNDGGSSTGITFGGQNTEVSRVRKTDGTANVTLDNVEIFGIGNRAIEKVKFQDGSGSSDLRGILLDAMDWMSITDQIDDKSTSKYIGDAYSDLIFAVDRVVSSWYTLNALYVTDEERAFVFDGDNGAFQVVFPSPASVCGCEVQLHSNKGAFGLKMGGVQNLNVDGLYIHNVQSAAALGADWCGQYEGYTATRAQGMVIDYVEGNVANVRIEAIESFRGEANGLVVYEGCDVVMDNVAVDAIRAGTALSEEEVEGLQLPNLTPKACGLDIRNDTVVSFDDDGVGIIRGDDINGFETCDDDIFSGDGGTAQDALLSTAILWTLRGSHNTVSTATMLFLSVCLFLVVGAHQLAKTTFSEGNTKGETSNMTYSEYGSLHENFASSEKDSILY